MDLLSCIKSVEDEFSLISEMGLPCIFEGQQIRRDWKKHRTFWHIVITKLKRAIKRAIKYEATLVTYEAKLVVQVKSLQPKFARHHLRGLAGCSLWAKTITALPDFDPDYFKGKVEGSRDPPLVFIPLPKIESNGCARSDLPIRSLIF